MTEPSPALSASSPLAPARTRSGAGDDRGPGVLAAQIPTALVAFRLAAAPMLAWDAWDGAASTLFVPLFFAAFASDVLDGIVARRIGVSTAELRMADSIADISLYGTICACVAWIHPGLVEACALPIAGFFLSYALWWVVNLLRYGKPSSYHTYLAKTWNVSLCVATLIIFLGGSSFAIALAIGVAAGLGVLRNLEEITMSAILPEWTHDVPSLAHALRLRREQRGEA
ncbi:hypothetical protein PPSIR1_36919 [Plesiocystis pacifica SIR-1]|uniref:CDP-alcohol phosphatidyltransferase n=1 Tax=Plesiocystis pacifica SIR-1 TaxID=391625 RepID=A6G0E9_9BACT|nr:CDP-alcohol phosphatidyltransferase family protein [Plesiocystis pacifica]EDM80595.1 hypothetical protein PPSIR1_36919 [Plesiocystis pacifica SIR-1]